MYCYVQEAAQFANVFISGSLQIQLRTKLSLFGLPYSELSYPVLGTGIGIRTASGSAGSACFWASQIRVPS
jgi:hypothetical protein